MEGQPHRRDGLGMTVYAASLEAVFCNDLSGRSRV